MREKWKRARQLRHAATGAERQLWRYFRRENLKGYKFRRQYPMASYIVDFVCLPARMVIGLDGGQQLDARDYDVRRTHALEAMDYRVLRFWNDDVLLRMEWVLEEILRNLADR